MSWLLNFLAGAVCGVLSGWGIGGGSLLLIYMTVISDMPQAVSQGINLVYFLPASAGALVSHIKNRLVDRRAALLTAIPGTLAAVGGALLTTFMDDRLLRRIFGIFLLVSGFRMLFGGNRRRS